MSHLIAVCDACVLYPAPLRDLLIRLGQARLFRARCSQEIHEEWIRSLLAKRPDLSRSRLERTASLMETAIPGALVGDYEYLIDRLTLPDPNDRHVLAVAIHGGARIIITFNLKDFPATVLTPLGIRAMHPDEFIENLIALNSRAVVESAKRQRAELIAPPLDVDRFLSLLRKHGLSQTCSFLEAHRAEI